MTDYREKIDMLPAYMHAGLLRYIEDGVPPGHFLTAVLQNDLLTAVGHADSDNLKAITAYAQYLMWYAPSGCYGSKERFDAWVKEGGVSGRRAERLARVVYDYATEHYGDKDARFDVIVECMDTGDIADALHGAGVTDAAGAIAWAKDYAGAQHEVELNQAWDGPESCVGSSKYDSAHDPAKY